MTRPVRPFGTAGLLLGLLVLPACAPPARRAPTGLPLLLVSDRGGSMRVYEEIEAGAARRVGDAPGAAPHSDWAPARLPSGAVVFVSDRDGNAEIYLAAPDGAVSRLTADPAGSPAVDSHPAPLGRDRIVFARGEPGEPEGGARDLYTMRLDGGDRRRLTRDAADDAEPWGSEDGRAVVFVSTRRGGAGIFCLPDVDAPDPEAGVFPLGGAAGNGAHEDHGPIFLPDRTVVFSRGPAGGIPQLYLTGSRPAGEGLRQITEGLTLPHGASEPVALPDGGLLLVTGPAGVRGKSGAAPLCAVYRIALGGFNLSRVSREHAAYSDFTRLLAAR